MSRFDYMIIGGGIVGLSVAWAILERRPSAQLAVLEKEKDWALHQTGRNSGVIHSGIYYKPGSLKATLCRDGNRQLREFCDTHGIHYEVCGKVIVATKPAQVPLLDKLYARGIANGLDVRQLSARQVHEIEPHVRCLAGLHVPSTGIVDYTEVCCRLAELIQRGGGVLRLGAHVRQIRILGDTAVLETDAEDVTGRWIVNCAGLQSDRVAKMAGVRPESQIVPFRGEYYELKPERRGLVRHLIYPVPDPQFPFLGVHFTRMIDGSVHAGPNAVLSLKREGYHRTSFNLLDSLETLTYPGFWRLVGKHARMGLEEMYRSLSKQAFVRSLQELIPEVQEEDLVPAAAGVRAQALRRDGSLVDDFMIISSERSINVCNAPSPAATASLEIGRTIAMQVPE
ncbi:L-2-hydroxyglutarate oxidase [Verrucomicrobiota bacterium sgz303538]